LNGVWLLLKAGCWCYKKMWY